MWYYRIAVVGIVLASLWACSGKRNGLKRVSGRMLNTNLIDSIDVLSDLQAGDTVLIYKGSASIPFSMYYIIQGNKMLGYHLMKGRKIIGSGQNSNLHSISAGCFFMK